MENFAELMQSLLEIQSGGRQRSPELIEEDARLMDRLKRLKRTLTGKPRQTVRRSQDTRADAIQGPTSPPWSNNAEMQNRVRQQVGFGAVRHWVNKWQQFIT